MQEAKKGSKVKVHYTGKFENGSVFDSSDGREPLGFEIGTGQMIPGFEDAVVGMKEGEKKTETVTAEQAYGERKEDLVVEVDRSNLPEGMEPKVGQQLQVQQQDGQVIPVVVAEVAETTVTIDANHPLAGHDLTFDIELVEVS